MTRGSSTGGGRRRARVVATLVGGALTLGGSVAVGTALANQHPAPPQPDAAAPQNTPAPQTTAAQRDAPGQPAETGQRDREHPGAHREAGDDGAQGEARADDGDTLALDYAEPVRLTIPSIGVSSTLVDLGLQPDGAMQTPQDPDKAGWFSPGPAPGVPGASVIAGHVTWNQRPTVFFRLGDLRPGDRVKVARKDGTTAVFEVTRVGTFPKRSFPTDAVYGQVDHPALRLITCGGEYDEQTNSYRANIIVWARMVASHRS